MSGKSFDDPFYDRFRTFLTACQRESERGLTLVVASVIEEMLGEVLASFLLEEKASRSLLSDGYAPLSSFKAKLDACRAMGLISSQELHDIEIVRKIRNQFAHNIHPSFKDASIADAARAMKTGLAGLDALPKGDELRVDVPRHRFEMSSVSLITALYNRAHYVRAERLKDRVWPS